MTAQAAVLEERPPSPERVKKAKKATMVAVFGTFIEYYDFSVYGYVAATLAVVFFPTNDPVMGLLNTLLVFGAAFVVRPIGAIFFGRLGDKKGRRTSLIASVTLMGAAGFITGLLPGYAQIGVWAPILLVLMRILQGFSTGGEIGGAASYIREWAPPKRRPLYISFIPSIAQLGKGMAAGIAALVALAMSGPAMEAWGWRIPFLLALPLGALCLYMRLQVEDSPEFVEAKAKGNTDDKPVKDLFKNYRAPVLKVILIATVQTIGTYVGTVYISVYFSNVLGFSKGAASTVVLLAVLLAAVLIPIFGLLGNRFGGKRILVISFAAYVLLTLPAFLLMNQGNIGVAMAGLALSMIPYALCQAGTYAVMPEFFPVEVRHTGVAFSHSTGAVIGGLTPFLATYLIGVTGNNYVPGFMMVIAGLTGFLVITVAARKLPATASHLYS